MMWPKSCPRCRGDLLLDSDYYGRYVSCIQCGATLDNTKRSSSERSQFIDRPAAELPDREPVGTAQERVA